MKALFRINSKPCAHGQPKWFGRFPQVMVIVVALLAAAASGSALAQHHAPVSLDELVEGSGSIAVGTLVSAQPRWNPQHNLIFTDYRFRIDRTLIDGGIGNHEFIVSQAGGTLDGETHGLSSNPRLDIGERYVVFLDPDANQVFCPFMGGDQGLYRITDDGIAHPLSGQQGLPLDSLLAEIDTRVQRRGNAPPSFRHAPPPAGITYPAKTAVPLRAPFAPASIPSGSLSPLPRESSTSMPEPRAAMADSVADPQPDVQDFPPAVSPAWHTFAKANRPIIWDEWPHDWWVSPHDQYMMSTWNRIADNLNRISGAELTTWAWGNNRFEMVGFPDNATMIAQFGAGWGATTLAITYWRSNAAGVLLEADIAMNPAYCWTLDEARSAAGSDTCWGIDQTTLHELGHGWGLAHSWETEDVWWDSVMNYAPKQYRLPFLHEDDAHAARTNYPGATINTDGLISMYRTSDNPSSLNPFYTGAFPSSLTIYHGGTLNLGTVQIENLGTTAFSNPQVGIYLAQNWRAWTDSYHLLRTASYTLTVAPSTTRGLNVSATTIPSSLPTGRYYPTLYLPVTGDESGDNNTAASSPDVTATIKNNPVTLDPVEAWRISSLGRIGPSGTWEFRLPVVAGDDYELSLCSTVGGGSADFDSVLEVIGVVSNDDYCSRASRVSFTSSTTTTRTVRVSGYNVGAQGSFTLAYRRIPGDGIFQNGFD